MDGNKYYLRKTNEKQTDSIIKVISKKEVYNCYVDELVNNCWFAIGYEYIFNYTKWSITELDEIDKILYNITE